MFWLLKCDTKIREKYFILCWQYNYNCVECFMLSLYPHMLWLIENKGDIHVQLFKKKHYFNWGFSAKSYLRISTVCYNFRFPYTKNPVMVRSIFPFKIKKTLIFFQSYIFDKKNMKMCERCCWFCTKVSMEYMNCLQLFDKVFFYAISVESIMFVCFWMLI